MAEVEYAGVKVGGSKLLLIIPLLGTIVGGLWGGFELYNRLIDTNDAEDLVEEIEDESAELQRELRDSVYEMEREVQERLQEMDKDIRDMRSDLEERIQEILENPLNDVE